MPDALYRLMGHARALQRVRAEDAGHEVVAEYEGRGRSLLAAVEDALEGLSLE